MFLTDSARRNIEQTLYHFLDSYAEKNSDGKGGCGEEGPMVLKRRTIGETEGRTG